MNKAKLVIASNNAHKVEELQVMLQDYYQIETMRQAGVELEVVEDAPSFRGNALKKARELYALTRLDCLADDSGLEVEALGGAPGIYSARYAGEKASDAENVDLLLKNLSGQANRKARFVCCLALIQNGLEYIFEGFVEGQIAHKPVGNNGFGYDPVFIPSGKELSFAQMGADEKNALSHRKNAVKALLRFLEAH